MSELFHTYFVIFPLTYRTLKVILHDSRMQCVYCFQIDKKLMQAAGMVGRVRQEVAIHSRLKHPSVLELYTFFEDENYVYLVLELCHHGELQRYLKNSAIVLDEEEGKSVTL